MSHTYIRVKSEPPKVNVVRGVAIRIAIGLLSFCVLGVAIKALLDSIPVPAYITTTGQIEQTRVTVANIQSGGIYGGLIFYQIEALVNYRKDGKSLNQWLVASQPVRSRDILLARISQNPTKCLVFWPEGNPANVKCKIQDAWAQYPDFNP